MFVALLRGVNVGGKNRVVMKDLKVYFEDLGFTHVKTYINSGNIIFKSVLKEKELEKIIKTLINEKFEIDVPVLVVSYESLKEALDHAPDWWGTDDKEFYHHGIFLFDTVTFEDRSNYLTDIKEEYEKIGFYAPLIFHTARREFIGKTSYAKISSSEIFSKVTIRNANTCRKILALMEEMKTE